MSTIVFAWSLIAAEVMLALAMGCAALRMLWGPRAEDRVLGLDALSVDAMLLLLTFGIRTASALFVEIALVMSLLGFVATLALAKFLRSGEVIE